MCTHTQNKEKKRKKDSSCLIFNLVKPRVEPASAGSSIITRGRTIGVEVDLYDHLPLC